jgi:putative transposase
VLFYEDLDYILKSKPVYKALPAQCAQQTLKLLGKAWKSFFNAMKEWRSNPSKFLGRPKPPNYKEKGGETIITFTNQQCTIFGGYLHFPPRMELKLDPIKTRLPDTTNLREVRIVPRGIGYVVEIVYEKEEIDLHLNKDKVASIDIGLTNIVTIVNNIGEKPIVVKGGVVKSINQFYNKRLARYRRILNKQDVFVDSKRIRKLHHDRNNKIKTEFHRISRKVVEYLVENDIGSLAIGYNDGWKQRCEMRKDVKQSFVQIPFAMMIHQIEYKCKLVGIDVVVDTEAYTSKASFIDGDVIPGKYDGETHVFSGNRLKRGLYKSKDGFLINADVNGGYNIGRKAFPNAFVADGIEGAGLHPKIVVIR